MVRKVLRWRDDSSSDSELIWSALGELNDAVATLFTQLCALEKENPPQYSATVDIFCRMPASEVKYVPRFESHIYLRSQYVSVHNFCFVLLARIVSSAVGAALDSRH
jgi:hypothetical protein